MQCACAILSSVACLSLQCFCTLSHIPHDFRGEGGLWNIKCVSIFSTALVKNISYSRRNSAILYKRTYIALHVMYLIFLSEFSET
jgi:hypothetical protein